MVAVVVAEVVWVVVGVEVDEVVGVVVDVSVTEVVAVVVCDVVWLLVTVVVGVVESQRSKPEGQSAEPSANGRQAPVAKCLHGPAVPPLQSSQSATSNGTEHRRKPGLHVRFRKWRKSLQ